MDRWSNWRITDRERWWWYRMAMLILTCSWKNRAISWVNRSIEGCLWCCLWLGTNRRWGFRVLFVRKMLWGLLMNWRIFILSRGMWRRRWRGRRKRYSRSICRIWGILRNLIIWVFPFLNRFNCCMLPVTNFWGLKMVKRW